MSEQSEPANKVLPPCRLKFLFSRKAKRCVILRRGPSSWVRMILWDMANNEFLHGQWLNGPVRDFDLSPNGDHLIYFVSYHKTRAPYLWTAVSKPPYFTALAMWPISDAWGGYCAFVDDSKIYIEKGNHQTSLELSAGYSLKKYTLVAQRHDWDWKMKRNGWTPTIPVDHPSNHGMYFLVWKKKLLLKGGTLCLQNKKHGNTKPVYWLEGAQEDIALPRVDCADIDPYGRLVVAQSGVLHIAQVSNNNELILEKIFDFNAQVPEEILAPKHATLW